MAEVKSLRALLVALCLVLSPAVLSAQDSAIQSAQHITLQPGDMLKVTIWREDDLSGEFLVNEHGILTLPMVGEIDVTRIPLATLRDTLISGYRRELRNPSIDITPLRRILILGEVNAPGPVKVDPTISLAGAVALAGGPTASGDLRRLRVMRGGQIVLTRIAMERPIAQLDIRPGDQVLVGRRSWLERNSGIVASTMLSVTGIVISIITARVGR